jgi:hypothetical protein
MNTTTNTTTAKTTKRRHSTASASASASVSPSATIPVLILIALLSVLAAYYSPLSLLILLAIAGWSVWLTPRVLRWISTELMARAVALEKYREQHRKEVELWGGRLGAEPRLKLRPVVRTVDVEVDVNHGEEGCRGDLALLESGGSGSDNAGYTGL